MNPVKGDDEDDGGGGSCVSRMGFLINLPFSPKNARTLSLVKCTYRPEKFPNAKTRPVTSVIYANKRNWPTLQKPITNYESCGTPRTKARRDGGGIKSVNKWTHLVQFHPKCKEHVSIQMAKGAEQV